MNSNIDPSVTPAEKKVYPILSTEQRLAVRDLQIELVVARENAVNELKATEQRVNDMVKTVQEKMLASVQAIGKELGIEGANFDLGSLKFHD